MLMRNLLTAGAVVAAMAGTALAQGWGGHAAGARGAFAGAQFTASQQTQVHSIMQAAHQQTASARTQIQSLQQQIDTLLLSSGSVTEAQITPLVQQQETLRQQLDASRISTEIAVRNLLTSSQLAAAASTHAQLSALHQQEHAVMQAAAPATP
ncbi:periplasmic heavy metal sensor [Lichenicoccus sp.]|uniref:periplasmic heavy metal sensor n=1 Tax=Lichenicoccus sp. TaxID=2781899 RepID=UPI003D152CEC